MRRERITYIGAYHHVMNRGYDENDIFAGNTHKSHFLNFLKDEAGLKYREINEIDIFSDLSFHSLRSLYRISKERKQAKVRDQGNDENF